MTAVYDQNTGQWTQRPAHEGPVTGGLMRSGSIYLRKPGANETVAGNVKTLQSSGSPLMQMAGKQGEAFVARRGLLNSSMGAQASQQAMMQAALPIAQADAQIQPKPAPRTPRRSTPRPSPSSTGRRPARKGTGYRSAATRSTPIWNLNASSS